MYVCLSLYSCLKCFIPFFLLGNCGNPNVIDNAEIKTNVTVQTFRMPCKEGYVRKAGTSNFFKCKESKWINEPPLICIRKGLLLNNAFAHNGVL